LQTIQIKRIIERNISDSEWRWVVQKTRLFVRCKFECGWLLEITQSKRHGLIQLRSINFVHSGIVSMQAIYEVNGHVPCPGTTETLYLSVFDVEYSTLKTIKFCVGLYK
jgi:hypothetical protein